MEDLAPAPASSPPDFYGAWEIVALLPEPAASDLMATKLRDQVCSDSGWRVDEIVIRISSIRMQSVNWSASLSHIYKLRM
ncbi:hypothetical protein BaRGS_00027729 [Batillaria attramentaria]|uniref:Uncharacterized protein n=1 Tax=Batillaria attramentaria TaxID=370345 RepID=A0ABD0K0W0_9CAEN